MMKTALVVSFFLCLASPALAQEFLTDLNGFRLRQFREVPENELGKPFKKDKPKDGFEFEAYNIDSKAQVYMVFEYAKSNQEIMWSIQLTGTKKDYDCKFKGLKLGMPAQDVEKALGKPTSMKDMGK